MLGLELPGLIPFFNPTQSPLYLFHRQPPAPLAVFEFDGVMSTMLESRIRQLNLITVRKDLHLVTEESTDPWSIPGNSYLEKATLSTYT